MRMTENTLTSSQKLDAINWAAGCVGQSYGKFSQHLTEEQTRQIYLDYEQELYSRRLARENRRRNGASAARTARNRT